MTRWLLATALSVMTIVPACGRQAGPVMPLSADPWPRPDLTLIWHGTGSAFQNQGGTWERSAVHDYEFTVVQRRYGDRWESTKTMQRRHPDYNGSAGPREQTMHFTLGYEGAKFTVGSTLGAGEGVTDREFREATMTIDADVGAMAPFDTYRIDQHYHYEDGELLETVQLLHGERPWVKIEETATMFVAHRFNHAPTVLDP